jgi:hypothetical protein
MFYIDAAPQPMINVIALHGAFRKGNKNVNNERVHIIAPKQSSKYYL